MGIGGTVGDVQYAGCVGVGVEVGAGGGVGVEQQRGEAAGQARE